MKRNEKLYNTKNEETLEKNEKKKITNKQKFNAKFFEFLWSEKNVKILL